MKPPQFKYHRPQSLDEALHLLSTLSNARPLAGGQSLMPLLNRRQIFPDHLVDLHGIPGLSHIDETPEAIVIGSMTPQRDIELSPTVLARAPIIGEALDHTGHVQIRNRGTMGGSLCHCHPAAEQPGLALAMGAELTIANRAGRRMVAASEFLASPMRPRIEPGEILVAMRFPNWPAGHGHAFEEYSRVKGGTAVTASAVLLALDGNGVVTRASITLIGVAALQCRVPAAENVLIAQKPTPELLSDAAQVCAELTAVDDEFYSRDYRCHLGVELTRRALTRASERASRARIGAHHG